MNAIICQNSPPFEEVKKAETSVRVLRLSDPNPQRQLNTETKQKNKTSNKIKTEQLINDNKNIEDKNELKKYTDQLNQVMTIFNREIHFKVDDKSEKLITKIVNANTGELVRQIPPEEILRIMSRIDEMLGLLWDEKI